MERNVARLDISRRRNSWIPWTQPGLGNDAHAAALISELRSSAPRRKEEPHLAYPLFNLVYFPELLPPLLRSIIALSSYGLGTVSDAKRGPELIISYKIRSLIKEQPFWSALDSFSTFEPSTAVQCHGQASRTPHRKQRKRQNRIGIALDRRVRITTHH